MFPIEFNLHDYAEKKPFCLWVRPLGASKTDQKGLLHDFRAFKLNLFDVVMIQGDIILPISDARLMNELFRKCAYYLGKFFFNYCNIKF